MSAGATTQQVLGCSFCTKTKDEVSRLVAGPGVFICNECVGLCNNVLAEEDVRSLPPMDDRSDDELLTAMARLDASREHVEQAVIEHARKLRDRGVTWARIGESLGVSRQSAWERFSGEE